MNTDPVALAAKIEERATKIAEHAYSVVGLICKGDPEFESVLLHAVETKLMELRHALVRKSVLGQSK
jgi:hypothetical protein